MRDTELVKLPEGTLNNIKRRYPQVSVFLFDPVVDVCAAETVLMPEVCSGGDEVDPPVRPEDSGESAARPRALFR